MNLAFQAARGAFKARSEVKSSVSQTARLSVAVASDCDAGLARAVRLALRPKTAAVRLYVAGISAGGELPVVHAMAHAAVLICGADTCAIADLYRAYTTRRVPCLVVLGLEGASERAGQLMAREVQACDMVACDADSVAGVLGEWLLESLPDLEMPLGVSLSCCQDAQAGRVVGEAVRNNALVGALTFLKGADTPAMLACEVAMLFKLAGVYGVGLGRDRAVEVAVLVAYSLACKQVAGLVLRAPLPACVVKSAVAALATWLCGEFARQRMSGLAQSSRVTQQTQGDA